MEEKKLTCISCPLGCELTVWKDGDKVEKVTGNTCKRGEIYGYKEVINPTRVVTSSVKVIGGSEPMVSVKTKEDIPKDKMYDCAKLLKKVTAKAPVYIGDIILTNVAGTGVDIVATKNIPVREK